MKAQRVLHSLVWLLVFQPLWSQEFVTQRDFLTDHEVDVIREAQEPNLRITHYLHFATLRLELVRQQLGAKSLGVPRLFIAISTSMGASSKPSTS